MKLASQSVKILINLIADKKTVFIWQGKKKAPYCNRRLKHTIKTKDCTQCLKKIAQLANQKICLF
jgi:hypothetical protein